MRIVFAFLILIINLNSAYGQAINLGLNYDPLLSNEEAEFLDKYFESYDTEFCFLDKRIAFVTFELEISIISKPQFFEYWNKKADSLYIKKLLILDEVEKKESGGYDAVIAFRYKDREVKEKKRKRIIKRLAECEINKPKNLSLLGLDNNDALSNYESDFFNGEFLQKRKEFNFTNKKVGFFVGNSGGNLWSKQEYFESYKERVSKGMSGSMDFLLILTEEQKKESNGYDAIIVSWSKIIVASPSKNMIKRLRTKE
jgi:hypothetical protein